VIGSLPDPPPADPDGWPLCVDAWWDYDSHHYGRELTTPDVYCADPFGGRSVWLLTNVEAVYRASRWRTDLGASSAADELALTLLELVQARWPEARAEHVFVEVRSGKGRDTREFAGPRIPSRPQLVAALRPDMSENQIQLWLAFGRTAEGPDARAGRWWMNVPQDWRSTIDGGVRSLIDGDTYLPGLTHNPSPWGPGRWLAQLVDHIACGVSEPEGAELHITEVGPIEQVRRLGSLIAQKQGAMKDPLAAMALWRTRLGAGPNYMTTVLPEPSVGGGPAWLRWVTPVRASAVGVSGRRPSEVEAAPLAARLLDAYTAACDLSGLLERQADLARPPDLDEYERLVTACDGFIAATNHALSW